MNSKIVVYTSVFLLTMIALNLSAQTIELNFQNKFGSEPLELKKEYLNGHGEKVSFNLLNYFISNIQLTKSDGSLYHVPTDSSYFLVTQPDVASHTIRIRVPEGKYTQLSYTIGVDSLRSTQGADKRKGVLDVGGAARGMYWQWNSGYIFFKMEGKSPSSPDSLQNEFYYHIGGYGGFDKATLNNIRSKTIVFNKPLNASEKRDIKISVAVQVEKFFSGRTPIKVSEHPSVMWGPWSTMIADNYVDIFIAAKTEVVKNKR
jgi:hypothetical protein